MSSCPVIITAAGLATRFIPYSLIAPKEALPVFDYPFVKPIIQVVFEKLYNVGFRDFYIIVNRKKDVIIDFFTPDFGMVRYLESKGKDKFAKELREFYNKVNNSKIHFVFQSKPLGFGDAVLTAAPYIHSDFYVVAPDVYVPNTEILINVEPNTLFVGRTDTPQYYGVVIFDSEYNLIDIEEKPSKPKSNYVSIGYYYFSPEIFDILAHVKYNDELNVTDAIKELLKKQKVKVKIVDEWYDVGNVDMYLRFLKKNIEKMYI